MTEKLYYSNSHLFSFSSRVLSCTEQNGEWAIALERTAFFPGGGGQECDTGYIAGLRIEKVKEACGEILHFAAEPLNPGSTVECVLDREQRLRRMQNHSGEHVVSGIAHSLLGWENVGFHMGSEYMTIDFSGELSEKDLAEIERRANEIVRENIAFHIWFPDSAELKDLEYRSKLELTENVRIVEIPGVDRCACCAPHVDFTGEIGLIKLLSSERHRGGSRVTLVCGMDAYDAVCTMQRNITAISNLLSAKRHETAGAVERVLAEKEAMRQTADALGDRYAALLAGQYSGTAGNLCIFEDGLSDTSIRTLLNELTSQRTGICALFSGSDEKGYKYIIASSDIDLRKRGREINSGIGGRGGGSTTMIQGSASLTSLQIKEFIQNFE